MIALFELIREDVLYMLSSLLNILHMWILWQMVSLTMD